MITVSGPKTLSLPAAMGGDDQVYGLIVVAVTRGLVVEDSPDATEVSISGFKDRSLLDLSLVSLLVGKGAEVEGYPVFFEIDDVTAACPFADQNPTDENGDPIPIETWETWGTSGQSHKPIEIDGKWYRSNNVGASGEPLPASQWINPPSGVTLHTVEQYKAVLPVLAP